MKQLFSQVEVQGIHETNIYMTVIDMYIKLIRIRISYEEITYSYGKAHVKLT